MEDPYFIVKSDVERALENLTKLHDSFNKSQSNSHSNGFKEINDIRGEIKTALRDVQYDIEDIEETVRIVEANPKKFKINSNEINSRKQFIEASKDKLKIVDAAIRNAKTTNGVTNDFSKKKKQSSYAKTSKSGSNNVKYSKLESYHDEENDKFISNTVNEQQQLLHRQDEEVRICFSFSSFQGYCNRRVLYFFFHQLKPPQNSHVTKLRCLYIVFFHLNP